MIDTMYKLTVKNMDAFERMRAEEFYFWRTCDSQEIDLIEETFSTIRFRCCVYGGCFI